MRVGIDIETNSLGNPSKVWVIVCRDIDTGELHVFREPSEVQSVRRKFLDFADRVTLWIGHNWLEFDYPVLGRLLGLSIDGVSNKSVDTLVLSRLFNYSNPRGTQPGDGSTNGSSKDGASLVGVLHQSDGVVTTRVLKGHSIEAYGEELGYAKLKFNDFTKYSLEMETYCIRDVDISIGVYRKYLKYIEDPAWRPSIELEQQFQLIINNLHDNGFAFNTKKAHSLLEKVTSELATLDEGIKDAFPQRPQYLREVTPRVTRYGTLNKSDFRFVKGGDLSEYNGGPFSRLIWVHFNPSSHKQLIDVLSLAGWSPIDKTASHIEFERGRVKDLEKQKHLSKYGWKVNENNLTTLPDKSPKSARLLAKRILLESRRRTLTEWLGLVGQDNRIHGRFYGIGTWTHRMSHQKPNTANIPNDLDTQGQKKLLGKELRSLWMAPKNRLLVGVDAEGIQLRIFAHLIDDPEFTDSLVKGKKDNKTDPHSLNQRIIGSICKDRAAAKRFIYALLLGAGVWKLSQILECTETECREALDRLLRRYSGFDLLKQKTIPKDASRGFFIGLDGRKVLLPGETLSERKHLAMSGYLQNGEAVVMKKATLFFLMSYQRIVN